MFEHQDNTTCSRCSKRFSNIFCNRKADTIEKIEAEKTCVTYKKGEYIFKEDTYPHGVFCINKGKVKLTKLGQEGKEQIIRLAKPGDPLGYRSLLSGDKYHASAIAIEDSGVCFIPKELFMAILQQDAPLTLEMFQLLSNDLKQAENHLIHLAQKSVRERLAMSILFIRETYGVEADGETLASVFSREEIANLTGTATETAIRLLSEFSKDGYIALKGKKILVKDLAGLVHVANVMD